MKMAALGKRERPALFDLHQDLGERLDIADQHPDIVETIMAAVSAPSWRCAGSAYL